MDFDDLDDLDPVEMPDPSTEERELAVVVFGASGYIGGLICEKLDALFSKPETSKQWALAGRNKDKLRAVARKCQTFPGIFEAANPSQISQMCNKTRVVVNAAGPLASCGEDIVRECINQVTHYIDISNEVLWVSEMVRKYHSKAKEKGAMIVHCAGATCAVDEILCYTLAKKLGPLRQFREYFRHEGGLSGGVIDTEISCVEALTEESLQMLHDPFSFGGSEPPSDDAAGTNAGKLARMSTSEFREARASERSALENAREDLDDAVARDSVFPSLYLAPTYRGIPRSRAVRRSGVLFSEAPSAEVKYGDSLKVVVKEWAPHLRGALQIYQQAGTFADIAASKAVPEQWAAMREAGSVPASRKGPASRNGSMLAHGVAEGENGQWAYAKYTSGDALDVTVASVVAASLVLVEELETIKPKERAGILTPGFAFHGSTWFERLQADLPSVKLEVKDGKPSEDTFVDESSDKPFYVLASPLTAKPWQMPALDAPLEAPKTAWPVWEPMPADLWSRYPRAGRGAMPENMGEFKRHVNEAAKGEFWGIEFPFSPDQLRQMGPKWLTKAMHTTGALPRDNEVVEFTRFVVKSWAVEKADDPDDADFGGAGCKVFMSVKYKNNPGELGESLFVKMPHEFNGKNERFKNSMGGQDWNEVMFYNFCGGRLPVRTPRSYFSDMNRRTTNFCMVLETVPYGDKWDRDYGPGQIWPNPAKYRDWVIPRHTRVDMYFAHARAQARFYGWYVSNCSPLFSAKTNQPDLCFGDENGMAGKAQIFNTVQGLGPLGHEERDRWFLSSLSDPALAGFVYSSGQPPNIAQGYVELAENFVGKTARHTFPREWTTKAYFDRWINETKEMCPYLAEMGWYTDLNPELFTLCHPNAMIDNGFYWRDGGPDGKMQCGLLDWGGCCHMSMPRGVAGCWIASEVELIDEYEEQLVRCFLDEYEKATGVKLDYDLFYMHLKLAYIQIHVGNCASVRWCTSIRPKDQWDQVVDRFDGKIDDGFMMRCYHVQTEIFLGMWKKRSPYPYFQEFMKRTGMPRKQ